MNETNGPPSIGDAVARWRAQQPALGGELRAMAREAVKDVRGALHEVFFGRPEGPGEPGAPLNPTTALVTDQLQPERSRGR